MSRRAAAGVLLAVCSCGGSYHDVDTQTRRAAANLRIYTAQDLSGLQYWVVQEVSAISCAREAGSSPSMEAAESHLKIEAARVNANGLTNVLCAEEGIDWSNNCWKTARCTGDAIIVSGYSQSQPAPRPSSGPPAPSPAPR